MYRAADRADVKDAAQLGVTGTPTFFVNGRPVHGNQPLKVFADVVDEELARARAETSRRSTRRSSASGTIGADTPKRRATSVRARSEADVSRRARAAGASARARRRARHDRRVGRLPVSVLRAARAGARAAAREVRRRRARRVSPPRDDVPSRRALAAEAAVAAADQGKFWAFHDRCSAAIRLARRAPSSSATRRRPALDLVKFRAALDDRRYRDVVVAETAAAEALGVDGTPTMFINGAPVIGVARTSDHRDDRRRRTSTQARTAAEGRDRGARCLRAVHEQRDRQRARGSVAHPGALRIKMRRRRSQPRGRRRVSPSRWRARARAGGSGWRAASAGRDARVRRGRYRPAGCQVITASYHRASASDLSRHRHRTCLSFPR